MRNDVCIGIRARTTTLALATLCHGAPSLECEFPRTTIGIAALRTALTDYGHRCVHLAVGGPGAIDLALALGDAPHCETLVVPDKFASCPGELALLARRMV